MRMINLLLCLSMAFFHSVSIAAIIEVPNDQPTIQQAINIAQNEDTVLVSEGTYFENISFNGKNITVASHFILENDPSFIQSTIINGGQPSDPDTASCVLFVNAEDSTAVIAGFTITGGKGTKWEDEHNPGYWYTEGGGILVQYSSPTIRNNIINGNAAANVPAGVTSAGGGAIRAGDSNPHIYNNVITHNYGRYGAGIVLNFSGASIKNNIIAYNWGGDDYGGGGLWCVGNGDYPKIIENNTIVQNHSDLGGGGIRIWSATVSIINTIIWGNTATGSPQVQGNGNITYCNIEGGYTGTGNINEDPDFDMLFVLSDDSPCVDTGNPDILYNDPEDNQNPGFAMFPAKGNLINDIGAYGGPGSFVLPDTPGPVSERSVVEEPVSVELFPNPTSNKCFTITLNNPLKQNIRIKIIDLHGILILDKLLSKENGYISEKINIEKFSSGLFTVMLFSGNDLLISRKIVVL